MTLLAQLQDNKGLVSSALSKELAKQYFEGETGIFDEAIQLLSHESKSVRSGAMVICEEIANKEPETVAARLSAVLPTLEVEEPQTRWMALRVLGKCAHLEPDLALMAIPKLDGYMAETSLALKDAVITYLGYIGALSSEQASRVFPALEEALVSVPKRITRVFESFQRITPVLAEAERKRLAKLAEEYTRDSSPSIAKAAKRTLKKLS